MIPSRIPPVKRDEMLHVREPMGFRENTKPVRLINFKNLRTMVNR